MQPLFLSDTWQLGGFLEDVADKTDFAFAPSDGGRHRTGRFGGDKL